MVNHDLYNFTVVAEELNITSAAARLFVTQQTLSEQIKRLEKQYGAQFFVRKPKLKLTPAGERMLIYCKKVLAEEAALEEDLQNMDRKKTYRIGYTGTRGAMMLSRAFPVLTDRHPGISIALISDTAGNLAEMMQAGRLDAYITSGGDCPAGCRSDIIYITSFDYICSRKLLSKYCDPEAIKLAPYEEQLRAVFKAPFSGVPSNFPLKKTLDDFFRRHGITPNEQYSLTSSNMNFSLCSNAQAGIVLPRELEKRYTAGEDMNGFFVLPLADMAEKEPLTLMTGGADPAVTPQEFLTILKDCVPSDPSTEP